MLSLYVCLKLAQNATDLIITSPNLYNRLFWLTLVPFGPNKFTNYDGYAVFYGCYQFPVWVWITPDSSLDVVSWQPTHIVVLEFYLECNYVSRAIPVPSTHSQHEKCAFSLRRLLRYNSAKN